MVSSPVVSIVIGLEKRTFLLHRDLLTVHSDFFRKIFDPTLNAAVTPHLILTTINPSQFMNFVIWLQSGTINSTISPEVMRPEKMITLEDEYEGLWAMGEKIHAVGFQNYCMKKILCFGEKKEVWPTTDVAQFAYQHTKKGSALRRLMADLLGRYNPMKICVAGSKEWNEWHSTYKKYPELSIDMLCVAGNQLDKKIPVWNDEWKERFMETEICLEDRWAMQILANETLQMVKKMANTGCVKSMLEFKHLESRKAAEENKSNYEVVSTNTLSNDYEDVDPFSEKEEEID